MGQLIEMRFKCLFGEAFSAFRAITFPRKRRFEARKLLLMMNTRRGAWGEVGDVLSGMSRSRERRSEA